MTLGERIKQLRNEAGLTQKEFAAKLNIGLSTLACYETDKREMPFETLILIADFFDVSTDFLLNRKDY